MGDQQPVEETPAHVPVIVSQIAFALGAVAGAVLDDDQGVDAPQQHGVQVDEAGGEDAAGLGGQQLPPGRARAAGRGGRYRPHA